MARVEQPGRRGAETGGAAAGGEPASARGSGLRISVRGVVAGLAVLLVAVVCIRFGFWQLDRLEWRRAQNAALLGAIDEPVLTLDAATAERISRDPGAYLYRRVRVVGRFQSANDVILRGRSHMGRPGVHLFTPIDLEGGAPLAVLVNRGWLPAADAVTVDPRPFGQLGVQEVEGIIQLYPEAEGAGLPLEREVDGFRVFSVGRLEFRPLQARTGAPLARFYVQQLSEPGDSDAAAATPVRLSVPAVDEGPHLGYAVQWFSFAAIFLIGFVVVVVRSRPSAPPASAPRGS